MCCVSGCSSDVTTLYQPSPTAAWILKTEGEDCALSGIKFLLLSISLENETAAPMLSTFQNNHCGRVTLLSHGDGGGGGNGVATNLNRARTDGGETQYVESAAFHVA